MSIFLGTVALLALVIIGIIMVFHTVRGVSVDKWALRAVAFVLVAAVIGLLINEGLWEGVPAFWDSIT